MQVPDENGGSNNGRGNPAGVELVPQGRYRFQGSKLQNFAAIPLTREYRVAHSNVPLVGGVPTPTFSNNVCNGLTAGVFQLPNFTFITPEHTTLGSPQYPGNYQDLGFLMTGNVAGQATAMGPLDPWPGNLPSNQPF